MEAAHRLLVFGTVLLALGFTQCQGVPPPFIEPRPSVSGTVTCRTKIALPPNAELAIRLVDFTQPQAAALVVAETTTSSPGELPLKFRLHYNPDAIDPRHDYALEARLVVAGRPRWTTPQLVPVVTKGRPLVVELVLQPVPAGT